MLFGSMETQAMIPKFRDIFPFASGGSGFSIPHRGGMEAICLHHMGVAEDD